MCMLMKHKLGRKHTRKNNGQKPTKPGDKLGLL